jgi:predicted RNA binding protein YcfA (HicA-like mRNA interferase family)
MAKKRDDLSRLKDSKKNIRFDYLVGILMQRGWELQKISGSHHLYSTADRLPIMIVKPHGNHKYCHPRDVNKVIAELELHLSEEGAGNDEENEA